MRRFFCIRKKHKKCQISLSTDILMDVLGHFSRKQICRLIYTVNRQLHSLASSPSCLPVIHIIDGISFEPSKSLVKEPQFRLFASKPNYDYHLRIDTSRGSQMLPIYAFVKMPKPGPLIRFGRVFINRYLEEPVLKFLNDISQSFVGCQLRISFPAPLLNDCQLSMQYVHHKVLIPQSYSTNQARSQVQYLLQNVFRKPSWVSICDSYLIDARIMLKMDSVSKCNKLQLCLYPDVLFLQESIDGLMAWLKNGRISNGNKSDAMCSGRKHLVLSNCPTQFLLDMVQKAKQDFENASDESFVFVVSFTQSQQHYPKEGGQAFHLSNDLTGEELSYFRADQFGKYTYRLWRRKILGEGVDAISLHHLQSPLEEKEFYSIR